MDDEAVFPQVISKLQRSCGEMSDEELGKFSVHLLNCQSDAERRTVYACSESMVAILSAGSPSPPSIPITATHAY